jgi:hypothetical protein
MYVNDTAFHFIYSYVVVSSAHVRRNRSLPPQPAVAGISEGVVRAA